MNIKTYQGQAERTLPDLGTKVLNTSHMIYGMLSEVNELYDSTDSVNTSEELSDISWYLANYCTINSIDLNSLITFSSTYFFRKKEHYEKQLVYDLSKLCNSEKRELAYKKPFNQEDKVDLVIEIAKSLNDCYVYHKINIFDSLQKNIDKLKARFPEKFNEHDALNRDLDAERKILEQ